jgi:hypothetical protein
MWVLSLGLGLLPRRLILGCGFYLLDLDYCHVDGYSDSGPVSQEKVQDLEMGGRGQKVDTWKKGIWSFLGFVKFTAFFKKQKKENP